MPNTLVPVRSPSNYQRDFSYVNHRENFPLQIRGLEENLINVVLVEPNQLSVIQNTALTKPKTKTDLPITSDYGVVGFESLLPIRGVLRELQYI